MMASTAYCPECDGRIVVNPHAALGKALTCPHCEAELEVIGVEPLELDWAYDWSWEKDDEDDDWDGQVIADLAQARRKTSLQAGSRGPSTLPSLDPREPCITAPTKRGL